MNISCIETEKQKGILLIIKVYRGIPVSGKTLGYKIISKKMEKQGKETAGTSRVEEHVKNKEI